MTIAQEEIFGPVLVGDPLRRRATTRCASPTTPTTASAGSVWTADVDARRRRSPRGCAPAPYAHQRLRSWTSTRPFGGFKKSGIGRELGPEGLEAYLELKTINLPAGWTPSNHRTCVNRPRYTRRTDAVRDPGIRSGPHGPPVHRGRRSVPRRAARVARRGAPGVAARARSRRLGRPARSTTPAGSACCSTPGTRASTGPRSTAAAAPRPPSTSSSSRRPSAPGRRTSA